MGQTDASIWEIAFRDFESFIAIYSGYWRLSSACIKSIDMTVRSGIAYLMGLKLDLIAQALLKLSSLIERNSMH